MKAACNNNGSILTLDFDSKRKHDETATRFIQFSIGDCKCNCIFCGRKDEHSLNMKYIYVIIVVVSM